MAKKKKKNRLLITLVLLAVSLGAAVYLYKSFFTPVTFKDRNYVYLYVETGDELDDVLAKLDADAVVDDMSSFEWLAGKMELGSNLHPGKYRINAGMTKRKIINLLKYNKQEKVKLSFNAQIRNIEEFIAYVDEKLEMDAEDLEELIADEKKMEVFHGLDPGNPLAMVVPGTYQVGWAISADSFFIMLKEKYFSVWNNARVSKARSMGLTVPEVITLASIVQSESSIESEQRKIAGVYVNRLRKGMPLQADPTLKFANRNYDAQRVYDRDKQINSPYNTYKFRGLPPGPICLVGRQAIDATLNFERHNYIYFCARPDLNGYSAFSSTYEEHRKHAAAYQKALDKLGIRR